jgi:hypothetical protein
MDYTDRKERQKIIETFVKITPKEVTRFKMRPDTSSSYNDNKVIEFKPEEELVVEFLKALTDSRPYQPQHDRDLAHWGIQIQTGTTIITSWFYIPLDTPGIVVGTIESKSTNAQFQSYLLRDWYQKYKDRWLTPAAPQPDVTDVPASS